MKDLGGRPRKDFDLQLVINLCKIQCTETEIAAVLDLSVDTIERRVTELTGMGFAEFFDQKRQGGRASLRRLQWQRMEKGSDTMLIFLGKQYLGQSDKHEVVGKLSHDVYSGKSTEELQAEIARLQSIVEAV